VLGARLAGRLGFVPEAFGAHLGLQRAEAPPQRGRVKGSSRAA
jgi:hypothetical protein